MTAAFLVRPIGTMLLLGYFLAVSGLSSSQRKLPSVEQEPKEELCPPCELFFRKLEENKETGKLTQVVTVQERGEPKSGTGLMMDWATGALDETCIYLQQLYGEKSCKFEVTHGGKTVKHQPGRPVTRRMVFEPALGASEARCPCETIDRVSIVLSKEDKHALPVNKGTCAFGHNGGIDLAPGRAGDNHKASACTFADGTRPQNNGDLWRCMQEANCEINDDWIQLAVFRDPRLVVVSTYFHLKAHSGQKLGDLKAFVARNLPVLCQWMAVRHNLFLGFLPQQSIVVWYGEAIADPLEWYYHFLFSVGLQLPSPVVKHAADAAATNNLRFTPLHINAHPGETARNDTSPRKFEDEVSPATVKLSNDLMRQWLPPLVLAKLGIRPAGEEAA